MKKQYKLRESIHCESYIHGFDLFDGLKHAIPIILLISIVMIYPVYAIPPLSSEIVIENIRLDPPNPQAGDVVTIIADIYNAGNVDSSYHVEVITVGFFINDELRKITELENIKTGESNKGTASTGPLWNAYWGEQKIEVIIDYHDTLSDSIDNPKNNQMTKIFTIEPLRESELEIEIIPGHLIPNKTNTIKISGTLQESITDIPLNEKNLEITIDGERSVTTTNESGEFSFTKALTFVTDKLQINTFYEGEFPYSSTNHTKTLFTLPEGNYESAWVINIEEDFSEYDFINLKTDIAIFQDSYDTLFNNISSEEEQYVLNEKNMWIPLESNHNYLAELYVEGRYFAVINWENIQEGQIIDKKIIMPNLAEIKFRVLDQERNPISNQTVNNWIYSGTTNSLGETEWMKMLPTRTVNEPYIATIESYGENFESDPFLLSSEERKIIEIFVIVPESSIPSWIKANAELWSENVIDDGTFMQGIQYLIGEKVITIPPTESGTNTDEHIPSWVKTNAQLWADDTITDQEFINAIQFLILEGFIQI